jgi:hypothetical protein
MVLAVDEFNSGFSFFVIFGNKNPNLKPRFGFFIVE